MMLGEVSYNFVIADSYTLRHTKMSRGISPNNAGRVLWL